MNHKKMTAIFYALLAALLYSFNVPFSKCLLNDISAFFMAGILYLGAGIGVGIMYVFHWKKENQEERLKKKDLPYTIGMVLLDILAPIFLMIGIHIGSASNASLLGNFEIVATSFNALLIFHETVSVKLWMAIGFITLSSILLSFDGSNGFQFSYGSCFVLLATLCWGLENNCTRNISDKSTYQIVTIKGLCSGLGSCLIAFIIKEPLPEFHFAVLALLLGFVAYGLSIFTYIRAQRDLGAAKTSAFYAVSPFIGAFLSFLLNKETLSGIYFIALFLMIIGTVFVVSDTIKKDVKEI